MFLIVCIIHGWNHYLYLNWLLVRDSYVDVLLMRWSLWPGRARQLEFLVDWQPRDRRTLLMCFSRRIYESSFFPSCNSEAAGSYRNVQACVASLSTLLISTFWPLYQLESFWITCQNCRSKDNQTSHLWIEFFFSTCCDNYFNGFFFCCLLVLSDICLFIMDREISCLLFKNKM